MPDEPGEVVLFDVLGVPVPKGSMRAFPRRGGGRPIVTHDNAKTQPWQQTIAWTAKAAPGCPSTPWAGPVSVSLEFRLARPKGHYRHDGSLTARAPLLLPTVKPDIDKLARAVLDALTGIIWIDDSQVVEVGAIKRYCGPHLSPGLKVSVRRTAPRIAERLAY